MTKRPGAGCRNSIGDKKTAQNIKRIDSGIGPFYYVGSPTPHPAGVANDEPVRVGVCARIGADVEAAACPKWLKRQMGALGMTRRRNALDETKGG